MMASEMEHQSDQLQTNEPTQVMDRPHLTRCTFLSSSPPAEFDHISRPLRERGAYAYHRSSMSSSLGMKRRVPAIPWALQYVS